MSFRFMRKDNTIRTIRNGEFIVAYMHIPREYLSRCGAELNSIPRWENKGHTAEELFMQHVGKGKAKMPGRNDPCPCGSGRKYKNCCGKRLN